MIAALNCSASLSAIADFPAAVGPQITRMLPSAKSPLELVPRELDHRRSPVHVVGGKCRARERDEQRPHLTRRHLVSGLDRGLAGDGCRQPLVALRHGAKAV